MSFKQEVWVAEHTATIRWQRKDDENFLDIRYSRAHHWSFDGGAEVPASSSPHNVPVPMSDPSAVDPEEAFIASISSCHMLWFLSIAAKRGFIVNEYVDHASGKMGKNPDGKLAVILVTLSPQVTFHGERQPARDELEALHHAAHESCFIANSVKSEICCQPIIA